MTTAEFITDFFTSFTEQALRPGTDPESLVDRYYTPDIVQISDGVEIDRARLIAHLRPIRKNLVDYRFEVHDAVEDGDRIAARFTIHARMRKAGPVTTEVHMFAELAPDRRMRRTHQLTRLVREAP
ncbi:MAG TPA: nuclear transport factor 2 family protein [Mycobacteriales bacterium]|nr:nuclear transport factor 2 family protein [Mycobacteriales bacterium]